MKALVLAWGDYLWLAEIAAQSLRRKWGGFDVKITDWCVERPANFSRLLAGEMEGRDEPLYITPADTFIVDLVLGELMRDMVDYLKERQDVVRLNIAHDEPLRRWHEHVQRWRGMDFVRCSEWRHCSGAGGLLLDAAMWNPAQLRECLRPGWAIEMVESIGSDAMFHKRPDLFSVGVMPTLFKTAKLVDHFSQNVVNGLGRLNPEDADAVRAAMPANWREA